MKTNEKPIVASEYGPVATVAESLGIARTTLKSAVERGEIESRELSGGSRIVRVKDAQRWAENRPKIGRPKKAE
jgi:predicted site-specific integrase-resolvase